MPASDSGPVMDVSILQSYDCSLSYQMGEGDFFCDCKRFAIKLLRAIKKGQSCVSPRTHGLVWAMGVTALQWLALCYWRGFLGCPMMQYPDTLCLDQRTEEATSYQGIRVLLCRVLALLMKQF